jgi:hypothetical protein
MNSRRTIKPAWELRSGDVIETNYNGVEYFETVAKVRRFFFDGEFEGKQHRQSPMVTIELAQPDGAFVIVGGDKVFMIHRRKATK